MRKILTYSGIAIVLWIAWLAWPLTALHALVRAVETRDIPAIAEQIDAPAIRRSLAGQIIDAYNRITGANINRNSLFVAVASSIADPLVATIVSPEGLALLFQSGWVSEELATRPNDARGLSRNDLGNAWQIFLNSHRGFDEYSITFPADQTKEQQFELGWRLRGFKWRLASVRLPERLAERLAQKLIRAKPAN